MSRCLRRHVLAAFTGVAVALALSVPPTSALAGTLKCEQKCPDGTSAGRSMPDDGVNRCECSCTSRGAVCSLRRVNHSPKAQKGQSGSKTAQNGSSCSMHCQRNECFEGSLDLKKNAWCRCFECSELDPKER
jgi:hypothetical protein